MGVLFTMPRSPRQTAVVYAEVRLESWGKWSRDNSDALGLPRVAMIHKIMRRKLVRGTSRNSTKLTAKGKETLSFRPQTVGEMPEVVAEVDKAVGHIPGNLQNLLKVEYIHMRHASAEDRAKAAGTSRRRYGELLECAKYAIFVALQA